MKNKSFIAINLHDFHKNQDEGKTCAEMLFIRAENLEGAKEFVKKYHKDNSYTVICKETFDKNIAY